MAEIIKINPSIPQNFRSGMDRPPLNVQKGLFVTAQTSICEKIPNPAMLKNVERNASRRNIAEISFGINAQN